ncbi:hypothetical protein Bca52824_072881 [Brassica carinata]|uniref:Uncharacterized protein n=1 Tax=Brassica carinata TaxID=52824 RepID=A0A8X7U4P2_BRACI|nr:hypothetical protein Bca52824_072881 [Brassica carinata]
MFSAPLAPHGRWLPWRRHHRPVSLLSFRSSSHVLCCSRSRYLSIGAPMVSSRPKVYSTPLFYGDSRSVNLCRSFTRRLTVYRPPHRGLRSVSSNRRSVYFILPLSISFSTTTDVLTVVSGIPHKTRFRSSYPPNSAAGHRASSASLFQQGHDSTFLKPGLQILNLGLVSPIAFNYKWSSPLLSQPTFLWGFLISLINCLKTSDGFNGVFTEADLHTTPYFSCGKSFLSNHLPVGSPGSPSPPLASVLVKKRTVLSNTSLLKSVSLPNIKWKSPSISIADLLSCGAVRSGPEDATDFVSTILRGADWVLTSPFHVTISQLSNCVVKTLSTHLKLSILSAFGIVVYLFNQRG